MGVGGRGFGERLQSFLRGGSIRRSSPLPKYLSFRPVNYLNYIVTVIYILAASFHYTDLTLCVTLWVALLWVIWHLRKVNSYVRWAISNVKEDNLFKRMEIMRHILRGVLKRHWLLRQRGRGKGDGDKGYKAFYVEPPPQGPSPYPCISFGPVNYLNYIVTVIYILTASFHYTDLTLWATLWVALLWVISPLTKVKR